jgi:hypothetical protein
MLPTSYSAKARGLAFIIVGTNVFIPFFLWGKPNKFGKPIPHFWTSHIAHLLCDKMLEVCLGGVKPQR